MEAERRQSCLIIPAANFSISRVNNNGCDGCSFKVIMPEYQKGQTQGDTNDGWDVCNFRVIIPKTFTKY